MTYKPMMSERQARIILDFHNRRYAEIKKRTLSIKYLGRKFIIPKEVHVPSDRSKILGRAVLKEVKKTDRVLDMGTGSGVNAILAASKSSKVIAVDINPFAVKCAKYNARLNEVSSRIKFLKSDVFQNVEGKFDLIIFDPPFRWFAPRDIREVSTADENFKTLSTFFKNAKKYLNKDGRMLTYYGTSGDLNYLKYLINKAKFKRKVFYKKKIIKYNRKWMFYSFKLTQ